MPAMLAFLRRLRPIALPAALLGLGLGAAFAFEAPVSLCHYCADCGIRREERQVRFAGHPLPVRAPHREAPSHLSEILRSAGVGRPHLHRWRPTECPILRTDVRSAAGQAILAEAATPRVISFVRELETYADANTVARWHAYLANASFLRQLESRLRFLRYSEEGMGDRAAFMRWWTEHSYSLYREIEITPMVCC